MTDHGPKQLLQKALKECPRESVGRRALLGVGFALLGIADELRGIRSAIDTIAARASDVSEKVKPFDPAPMAAALAGDVPRGCKIAQCRSCDAPIFWAKTTTGKNMPIDAKPIAGESGLGVRDGVVSRAYTAGSKYESHFSTCPDAADHRKAST